MNGNYFDIITGIDYFIIIPVIGFWSGRVKQNSAADYFISKKSLPWWAIGEA
jgi:solute:Na+ symporter, SSS family